MMPLVQGPDASAGESRAFPAPWACAGTGGHRRSGAGARWLGFHVPAAPGDLDRIRHELLERLRDDGAAHGVRRWFHLHYHDDVEGLHLRLRVLPHPGTPPDVVRALIAAWARGHLAIERGYDREALYFGETWASVHAELLHAATSRLALRMLAGHDGASRARRFVLAGAALAAVLRRVAFDPFSWRHRLVRGEALARTAALATGVAEPDPGNATVDQLACAATVVAGRIAGWAEVERVGALLRRTVRAHRWGEDVATHALHLLCNKIGVSLWDERALYVAFDRAVGVRTA